MKATRAITLILLGLTLFTNYISRGGSMLRRTATAVCSLALTLVLLMAVVTGPAGASVHLSTIGTADISGVGTVGLIYDSDQSLFWLDYSNGTGDYNTQMIWVSELLLTNVVTPGYNVTWTDPAWRLPTTIPALGGYDQKDSEMGHLYYTNLLLTKWNGVTGVGSANQFPFTKLEPTEYWSGTYENPFYPQFFNFSDGYQGAIDYYYGFSALAVRSGQLESSAVPEPSTYLLLGISLGVVGYARRKMVKREG
jgi:hypothetical protein